MAEDEKSNKIIVVDDDPEILELLSDTLRGQGYEPMPLRRGRDVVKTVKDQKPGAVILDLALPDRDGRLVLKELKDDWDAKKVPVIVLSAYTARLDHAGRDRVEAVFTKPFELDQLLYAVRQAMEKKRD